MIPYISIHDSLEGGISIKTINKVQLYFWFFILFLIPWKIYAQSAETGGVVSPFELGGSARALGMGDTSVAMFGDGNGFFMNPSILATVNDHEILTMDAPLYEDTLYDSIGYVQPIAYDNSFAIGVARIGTTGILQTSTNIQALSTFSSQEYEGLLSYGYQIFEGLDIGATAKYLFEQLGNYQGDGAGMDLGILCRISQDRQDFYNVGFKNLTLGFSVSNFIQPQIKLFETSDQPVRIIRPALSYYYCLPSTKDTLWFTLEGELQQNGSDLIKAGGEYGWNQTAFGRVGFDGVGPTLGAGLRFYEFEFDYAFNQRDLGPLHRFSLTYHFGEYEDPLQAKLQAKIQQQVQQEVQRQVQTQVQAQKLEVLKWMARSYADNNDYNPAIVAWENVNKEFPDDKEAPAAIESLKKYLSDAIEDQLKLAKTAMDRGEMDKALPFVAKALALDPNNSQAKSILKKVDEKTILYSNYTMGLEAYSKENYKEAVEYLGMVYEINSNYRNVRVLYHDAQSHYLPLESMPKDLSELYAAGVNYYMSGNYAKAIESWQKVLNKNPKNYLVQRNIAEARSRLQEKGPSQDDPQSQEKKNQP